MTDLPKLSSVDFVPHARDYVDRDTGAVSGLISDLALKRGHVSLNPAYHGQYKEIRHGGTIFNEITITSPVVPESIQRLIDFGSPKASNDAGHIVSAIASVIERRWDPKQFHVVLHSSGYDSRIISKIITTLRDKYGKSWLGDVLFVCWEPEGPEFRKIMEFEGWSKEQYHVCNTEVPLDEYYAGALDFSNCWRWTNDAQPPIWIIGPVLEQLREAGVITKPLEETQLISSGGGNEAFEAGPSTLIEIFHYSRWGVSFRGIPYSERIDPFLSWDVLQYSSPDQSRLHTKYVQMMNQEKAYADVLKYISPSLSWLIRRYRQLHSMIGLGSMKTKEDPRKAILSYLSEELLMLDKGPDDGPASLCRQLSPKLWKRCREDFVASWYYQHVILPNDPDYDKAMPKYLWRDDWWGEYAKASLCEYLVKNGVKIGV